MNQTNQIDLEKIYLQELDNDIITYLAKSRNISIEKDLDIYYQSKLCSAIHEGIYGIQYLDYKLLVEEYLDVLE